MAAILPYDYPKPAIVTAEDNPKKRSESKNRVREMKFKKSIYAGAAVVYLSIRDKYSRYQCVKEPNRMPIEIIGNSTLFYLMVGLLAGTLGATFGVGGGILMVPALTQLASMPQKEAQGFSLTAMIVLAIIGSIRYHLNPEIHMDWRMIAIISITMAIGANIGASLAAYFSGKILQIGFAILLFIAGGRMMWSALHTTQ